MNESFQNYESLGITKSLECVYVLMRIIMDDACTKGTSERLGGKMHNATLHIRQI